MKPKHIGPLNFILIYFISLFLFSCINQVDKEVIEELTEENKQMQIQYDVRSQYKNFIIITKENRRALLTKKLTEKKYPLINKKKLDDEQEISEQLTALAVNYSIFLDSLNRFIINDKKFIKNLDGEFMSVEALNKLWGIKIYNASEILGRCNEYHNQLEKLNKKHDHIVTEILKEISSNPEKFTNKNSELHDKK